MHHHDLKSYSRPPFSRFEAIDYCQTRRLLVMVLKMFISVEETHWNFWKHCLQCRICLTYLPSLL